MVSNGRYFLDIPTPKGLKIAAGVIVASLLLAIPLYYLGDKGPKDYALKLGDSCIQGALVTILFGILKLIIDSQKRTDEEERLKKQQAEEEERLKKQQLGATPLSPA